MSFAGLGNPRWRRGESSHFSTYVSDWVKHSGVDLSESECPGFWAIL